MKTEFNKEIKDTEILQRLYDEGIIDFSGADEDGDLTMYCIQTCQTVIDIYRKALKDKAQEDKKLLDELNNYLLKGDFTPEQLLFIQSKFEFIKSKINKEFENGIK